MNEKHHGTPQQIATYQFWSRQMWNAHVKAKWAIHDGDQEAFKAAVLEQEVASNYLSAGWITTITEIVEPQNDSLIEEARHAAIKLIEENEGICMDNNDLISDLLD